MGDLAKRAPLDTFPVIHWLVRALLVLALLCVALPARAGDDSALTFQAAKKLFEGKSYDKALPLFQDAYEKSKSPNAHVFIARCLRELGRSAEAYDAMAATVREATSMASSDPKYVPTRDSAAAELALLEATVGRIVVAIADAPGLEITINGSVLPADKRGDVVAVPPGKVIIEARATGKDALRREEMAEAGKLKTLTLAFDGSSAGAVGASTTASSGPSALGEGNLVSGGKGWGGIRPHFGVSIFGGPNIHVPSSDARSWGDTTRVVKTLLFGLTGGFMIERFDLSLEASPLTWSPDLDDLGHPAFQTNLSLGYHFQLAGALNYVLRAGVGVAASTYGGSALFVGRLDPFGLSALVGPVLVELDVPSARAITVFNGVDIDVYGGAQATLMLDDL